MSADKSASTSLSVSIIIVSHNSRADLARCLDSILAAPPDTEVIVVDNASEDGSADYAERAFPTARVFRNAVNRGFGHGSNLGARHAEGTFLAFLNPDTIVQPGWLGTLVAALEADPSAALATPKILLMDDPERINTCGNEVHYTGLTLCRGMGAPRRALAEQESVAAVSGAAFVIRRAVFFALGGFDELFFMYMEDADLSWRARLAGYRCVYVPRSAVYHDYALHFGPLKTFLQERNRYLVMLKALRWSTLLFLLPALLLAEGVTWGFVLLRDRRHLASKLRAYTWIVEHWGAIAEGRRRAQSVRRVSDRDLLAGCTHRLAYGQVGEGLAVRLAHWAFDPLFLALYRLTLAVIK